MTEPMRVTAEVVKCARAIYVARHGDDEHANHSGSCKDCVKEALACMEALMEPSKEMYNAARKAEHEHYWPGKKPTDHTWMGLSAALLKKLWQAMLLRAMGR